MKKRIMSLILVFALVFSLMSFVSVNAEDYFETSEDSYSDDVNSGITRDDSDSENIAEIGVENEDDSDDSEPVYWADSPVYVVFNLGNGNGTYNFADYSGSRSAGSLLRYKTEDLSDYESDGQVTIHLPSESDLNSDFEVADGSTVTLGHSSAYDYTLVGWVNIATKEYYDVSEGSVDAVIDCSKNNVFYADYIATDYDNAHSTDSNLRNDIVSTGDFVTIRMFDYTDLWNVYNATAVQNGVDSETWSGTDNCVINGETISQSFTFNNDGTTLGSGYGLLQFLSGRGARNTWTGTPNTAGKVYFCDMTTDWDIRKPGDTILGQLFNPEENIMGVNYVGEADYLFWMDNGYYTYDAEESAAVYNQSDERFYVYDSPQYVDKNGSAKSCFVPYNSYNSSTTAYSMYNGTVDYFFGMEMQVDFFLPFDVGSGNNKVNGNDMEFTFSGDDDIFIFVDDEILIDMSGIHDRSYSSVNFSTGEVKIGMGLNSDGSVDTTYGSDTYISNLSAGKHSLTVYYMERGGYESNLAISFNLTSVWNYMSDYVDTVIVNKEWTDGNENHEDDTLRMGLFERVDYDSHNEDYTEITVGDSNYIYSDTESYELNGEEYNYGGFWFESGGDGIGWYDEDTDSFYILSDTSLQENPYDLSADDDWTYTWELLLQDYTDEYIVREMTALDYYVPTYEHTQYSNPDYMYWSIVGETELEDSYNGVGSSIDVLLTDAAQSGEDSQHGLAVKHDLSIANDIVYSRVPITVQVGNEDESVHGENTYTMYGIISNEQVSNYDDNLVWTLTYTNDLGPDSYGDTQLHTFTLSCDDGYLKESDDKETLVFTQDSGEATEFYCDIEGQIRMYFDTEDRVIIEQDGLLLVVPTDDAVEYDNLRIYTLSEGHTDLYSFTVTNTFNPTPELSIEKTVNQHEQNVNDIAVWDIVVTETVENVTAYNVYIKDLIPDGLTIVGTPTISGVSGEVTVDGQNIYVTADSLAYGEELIIEVQTYVGEELAGMTTINTAYTGADNVDEINDDDYIIVEVLPEPSIPALAITKNVNEHEQVVDGIAVWTITVTETVEDVVAENVYIRDTIPDGLTVVGTPTVDGVDGIVYVNGQDIYITADSLSYGEELIVTIETQVNAELADSTTVNTAYAGATDIDEVDDYDYIVVVTGSFGINKTDDFGNTITGAEFTLTDSQGNLILFDIEDDVYTASNTGTTSVINAGYVTIDGLAPGTYTLAEIKAPDNYEGMSGMIEVTVDKDGSVTYEEIVSMSFFETIANAFESAWNSVKTFVVNLFDSAIAEVATEDYSIETTVINVMNHELTSVTVDKIWVDNNDCDGIRPAEINVDLFADGTKVDSATITATDNWEYTFTDLPKYNDGQEIAYTVSETAVDNYIDSVSGSASNGFVITNTHEPEKIDVSGIKTWIDNNNQDGVRPDEITVILYADGIETNRTTVTAADNWSYIFNNLAKYRDGGIEIVYTLAEIPVDNYTTTINGTNITNTYSPETTNISGVKTWIDNNDQDGIRPDSITVNLYADGVKVDSQIVTAADDWTFSFDNLDRYRDGGIEIVYTVTEDSIDGYTNVTNGTNFTNTHTPYVVDIPVQKMWNDNDDRDGIRPDSIDVVLTGSDGNVYNATLSDDNDWSYTFKDLPVNYNNGTEIVYELNEVTVDGYLTSITEVDGGYSFLIENTHVPAITEVPVEKIWVDNDNEYDYRPDEIQVTLTGTVNDEIVYQETAVLSEDTDWEYLFKDLFTYMDGTEVIYTISESSVDNYYTDITGDMIDGYTITNTAVTPKLDKELLDGDTWDTWDEADNDQEITFRLTLTDIKSAVNLTVHDYIDGEFNFEADTVEAILYDGENETVLENGTDYIVIENECTDPDCIMAGCTFEVSFNDDVFANVSPDAYIIITYKALTDTHADNYVGFVDQIYNEAYILFGATDSMHRSEIVSTETDLFGFDVYKYTDENGELVGLGNAEFVLSRNDMYAQFTTETDSNGNVCYVLTGWTDSIESADVIVSEADGIIRVDGLNNGTYALTETTAPVGYYELEDSIVFTIDETGTVIGDTVIVGSEYAVVGVENEKILTSVTGTKTWNDNDNYDGVRPDEITIKLYADGEEVDSMTVTAEDDWTYTFNDLAVYNDGVEIEYTITEDEVDGYVPEYNGYDVVNTHESETHEPETTSIGVTKVWNDEDNADGIRPNSVTIVLTANGEPTDYTIELTTDNDWTGVFEDLDIYADGNIIEYGLYELDVDGYTSEVTGNAEDGFIVTNTHEITTVVSEPKNNNPTVINNTSPTVVNNGTEPVTVDGQTTAGQETNGTNTTNTDSAKTGDNIIEIIAIMFVSLSAIGVIAYMGLKKRKEI